MAQVHLKHSRIFCPCDAPTEEAQFNYIQEVWQQRDNSVILGNRGQKEYDVALMADSLLFLLSACTEGFLEE